MSSPQGAKGAPHSKAAAGKTFDKIAKQKISPEARMPGRCAVNDMLLYNMLKAEQVTDHTELIGSALCTLQYVQWFGKAPTSFSRGRPKEG
jgi:hypothetical protein